MSPKYSGNILPPLDITCTSTNCENGLHCFKQTKQMKIANIKGICRECGADLVDWSRVYKRNPSDVKYTFKALKYEMVRHHYWHVDIDQKAINHARRKGIRGMKEAAEHLVRKKLSSAVPTFDGRQTPKDGNALFYAQHATASCCRKCVEYWHDIQYGRPLTETEIAYLSELLMLYVIDRLPYLKENGEYIQRSKKMH